MTKTPVKKLVRIGRLSFLIVVVNVGVLIGLELYLSIKYQGDAYGNLRDPLTRVENFILIFINLLQGCAVYVVTTLLRKVSKLAATSAFVAWVLCLIVNIGSDAAVIVQSLTGPFDQVGGLWLSLDFFQVLALPFNILANLVLSYLLWLFRTRPAFIYAVLLWLVVPLCFLRFINLQFQGPFSEILSFVALITTAIECVAGERWLYSEGLGKSGFR